jgi:hypothetical protein
MESNNSDIKLIGTAAAGVIGGLILGSYIWGNRKDNAPLSDHLSKLSTIMEEIESMKPSEVEDLKQRMNDILNAIESGYVKAEK